MPSAVLDEKAVQDPAPVPVLDVPKGFERRDRRYRGDPVRPAVADVGREPRRVFRYAPVAGSKQTVDVLVDRTSEHPRMRATVEIEIASVDDRWIVYRSSIVANRIEKRHPDEVIPEFASKALDATVGTRWAGVVDHAGHRRGSEEVRRTAAGPFLDTMIFPQIVVIAWPTEPIGVGARWVSLHKHPKEADGPYDELLEYELTAWDGERAIVDVKIRVSGEVANGEGTSHYEIDSRWLGARYRTESTTSVTRPRRPLRTMKELYEVTPR